MDKKETENERVMRISAEQGDSKKYDKLTVHKVKNGFTIMGNYNTFPSHIAKDLDEVKTLLEELFV